MPYGRDPTEFHVEVIRAFLEVLITLGLGASADFSGLDIVQVGGRPCGP